MIGLPGTLGLCILGSRYSVGVLVVFSGDKNLFVVSSMSWSLCIFLTSVLICCCIWCWIVCDSLGVVGVVKLFVCFSQIVFFGPNHNGSTFVC